MFLAFQISDIITVPFGWLLNQLYQLTSNYGIAMILFAVIVQLILLPITAKSKKSMMKMARLQPRIQEIQRKYADNPQKQNEAVQALQREEGGAMGCGGCLWSLVPMLILFPLYAVIRQPIVYMLHESSEVASQIVDIIREAEPGLFSGPSLYHQLIAAQSIPQYADLIREKLPQISAAALEGIQFNVFGWGVWDWAHIGLFLIPVLSAGSQVLQMFISQRLNDSVITNDKGMEDREAAKKSQTAQTNRTMMIMMPLMSLGIGFTVPAGLSLYWFIGGVFRMLTDPIITKHYRKVYDAEDAERMRRYQEQQAIEEEKERVRAERRAANPDGITANTSKKKMQQKQRAEEEAARAAAAREYAARKGIVEQEREDTALSGIPERPNCKGRAYDPNRYNSTEE